MNGFQKTAIHTNGELEYLLDRKDYYENRYSRGTEKEEYKQVLKDIKKLKIQEPA